MANPLDIDLEKQVRELEKFRGNAQKLFEHVPAIVFSKKGHVLYINETAEASLRLHHSQLVGKTLYKAGCRVIDESGKRIPVAEHPWIRAIKKNTMICNVVTGIVHPDGACQWQQSTTMPLKGWSNSRALSSITILTDITKYKMSQAQLLQSHKMEAIGALASGLAHDFNNILTSISSAVQLLLIDKDESTVDYETLKDIENGSIAGSELIKQLLLFSKPSHLKRTKTTNLNSRIGLLRRLLRRTMPKNIKMEIELFEDNIVAKIDPTQFEQILMNLAINSRDAMPDGGVFKITASMVSMGKNDAEPVPNAKPGTYAKIDVSDTGTGIPEGTISRLFEPFYSSKDHDSGTGLGLSIVYAIIKRQNGYIVVNSSLGIGTTMSIYLHARQSSSRKSLNGEPKIKPMGGHELILIVDDEELITKSTARFLTRYGYTALTAYNGAEGLKVYKKHQNDINLVLLDLEMPEMNGRECMKEVLALNPSAKVITFSGHMMKPGDWDPVQDGANAFVQKPYDFNDLLGVIRSTLNK